LTNFIVSPTVSFQTGLAFNALQYGLDIENLSSYVKSNTNPELGQLIKAESRPLFLELPIAINYRQRLNYKIHLIFGAGISPHLYTTQQIEYYYSFETDNNVFLPVESGHYVKGLNLYLGTLNGSIGFSKKLNNGNKIETSLFYKKGIGTLGIEKVKAQYMGISTSYQFSQK
jgi:hypothetical protein